MPKFIPKETVKLIKELRARGWSLPEIHKEVKIGYGSVFKYIKGVEILPQYQSVWFGKRGGSKKRKLLAESEAKKKALQAIRAPLEKEIPIITACLYWAEGNKKDFSFTNTDPKMIRVFTTCLQKLGIPKERFRVTIRIYEDLDKMKCSDFWARVIGISPQEIRNINVLRGQKSGKLAYGMCRIRIIKGGDMLKYVVALKERISNILDQSQ